MTNTDDKSNKTEEVHVDLEDEEEEGAEGEESMYTDPGVEEEDDEETLEQEEEDILIPNC
jgi:hypothetical protein